MFHTKFPIKLTESHVNQINNFCTSFELRDRNPEALNTPFLGIVKIYFTYKDQDNFLGIFGSSTEMDKALLRGIMSMKSIIDSSFRNEVKKQITTLKAVDESRAVQSDPFNLFITYIIHLVRIVPLSQVKWKSEADREYCLLQLFKIWLYKFFTSVVNNSFRHAPNEDVMRATLANMNNRFDLVKYGTWKNVIVERAKHHLKEDGIHADTILKYDDDGKILYLLSSVQTGLRNQIVLVAKKFYETEKSAKIGEYSLTGKDLEGEQILMHQKDTFDRLSIAIRSDLLSINKLISPTELEIAAKLYKEIRAEQLKAFLTYFNNLAYRQSKLPADKGSNKTTTIKDTNNEDRTIYVGAGILFAKCVEDVYRNLISRKIDLTRRLEILKATQNMFSANRQLDGAILDIKESIDYHIMEAKLSTRLATISAIRGSFICYVIMKTFKYLE